MFKSFLLSSTFKKKTTTTKCSYFNDKIHWLWLMIHPLKKIFLVPLNQSHTNHKQVPVNLLSNNRNTKFPKSHDKLNEKVPKKNFIFNNNYNYSRRFLLKQKQTIFKKNALNGETFLNFFPLKFIINYTIIIIMNLMISVWFRSVSLSIHFLCMYSWWTLDSLQKKNHVVTNFFVWIERM